MTHIPRTKVDVELAYKQWEAYVQALSANGWATVEVPPDDDYPDAAFVEDVVVIFDDLAVVTRPGAEDRRGETAGAEAAALGLGLAVEHIVPPGTLDGGDVLKVEVDGARTAYVGLGRRTNEAGIDQLSKLAASRGYRVVPVPMTKALHLKSAATALPDGTIIGYDDVVDDPGLFPSYVAAPEESGAHVVHLGDGRLLMAADCPQTTEKLRQLGYSVMTVDISEFERLEGCVTCLSVRVR